MKNRLLIAMSYSLLSLITYILLLQPLVALAQPVPTAAPGAPQGQSEPIEVVEVRNLPVSGPSNRMGLMSLSAAVKEKAQSLGYDLAPVANDRLLQEVTFATQRRKWKVTIEIGNVVITIGNKSSARLTPGTKAGVVTMIDGDQRYEVLLIADGGSLERVTDYPVGTAAINARGNKLKRWWDCFKSNVTNRGCGVTCTTAFLSCTPAWAKDGWSGLFKCFAGKCGKCWTQAAWQAFWGCI